VAYWAAATTSIQVATPLGSGFVEGGGGLAAGLAALDRSHAAQRSRCVRRPSSHELRCCDLQFAWNQSVHSAHWVATLLLCPLHAHDHCRRPN